MRIPDITLKRKIDPGMMDFMDYTMFILNDGLYQFRVLDSVPAWDANDGEAVLYSYGTDRRLYFYISGQWVNISWSNGESAPIALALVDYDEDTLVEVEKYTDEDKIRFTTADSLRVVIDYDGLAMSSDLKLVFNDLGGSTYFKYNSTSAYLECYVDGSKRMEL